MPSTLRVRIRAMGYARLVVGVIGGLMALPVVLIVGMLLFSRTARDPGTAVVVALCAAPVFWVLLRTLRPIVVTLDADSDRVVVRTPRVFWRARVQELRGSELARLEVRQTGELRRGNGPGVPTWSLLLVRRDGGEQALWSHVVVPSRPWSEPAATITRWCEERHARTGVADGTNGARGS